MLRLFNTFSRELEALTTHNNSPITIYTCGPTVYDYPHIGNWAAYIYWDILVRILVENGYQVARALNITDVGHLVSDADEGEDKLEKGAKREGRTAWQVARTYTDYFLTRFKDLGLIYPNHIAKATDYIEEQLEFIRKLKALGYTYETSDGIYYDTTKFPKYSRLARLNLDGLKEGARIAANSQKRSPADFALWKFSPKESTRDMEWLTPNDILSSSTGHMGFPGWHLECSAIIMSLFGPTITIHAGGIDHIPIHHTNEIAQTEAITNQPLAKFWIHSNHMLVDGQKISKSLQNGYTLEDLSKKGFSLMDFKILVLQSHYQTESNFSFELLDAAKSRYKHWRQVSALRWQIMNDHRDGSTNINLQESLLKIIESLNNNLDTPRALFHFDEAISQIERNFAGLASEEISNFMEQIDTLLGTDLIDSTPNISVEQSELIKNRQRARNIDDWSTADTIRQELLKQGILLRDVNNELSFWSYN